MKLKRANGTMLILVVAFMLILIVFCMATLAMVTVANNRAVTKFEENQSYYTAASALEIFTEGSLTDETYYAVDGGTPRNYYKADGTPLSKMTQGRALELDLYKLYVQRDSTATLTNPIGGGEKGDADIFSSSALNKIVNTTNGAVFSANSTFADQFTANPSYKYAEYIVELPAVSTGDNYGLFADTQTTGTGGDNYHAKIKVEVLERYYHMAGVTQKDLKEYMGVMFRGETPSASLLNKVSPILTSGSPDGTKIEAAILGGQRHKDYFRIRVTSETELLGVKGVTSREYVVSEPDENEHDDSNKSTGGLGNGDDNVSMTMTGGASAMGNLNMIVPDQVGSFYTERDYYMAKSGMTELAGGEYLFAKGHIIFGNAGGTAVRAEDTGAYLYAGMGIYAATTSGVGGDSTGNGSAAPGGSEPITVITGGPFDFSTVFGINGNLIAYDMHYYSNSSKLNINGDIYLNNFHPLPDEGRMINDAAPPGYVTPAMTFSSAYSSYTGRKVNGYNAFNIMSGGKLYVQDGIYLTYDPVDNNDTTAGSTPVTAPTISTKHYLNIGSQPLVLRSTTKVYAKNGMALGTAADLTNGTNAFGWALDPTLVTIDDTFNDVKVQYYDYTKDLITGETIQYFVGDPTTANGGPVTLNPNLPQLSDIVYKDYTIYTENGSNIVRELKLPVAMAGTTNTSVYLPTTQGKYRDVLLDSFFLPNGNLGKVVSGSLVDAWDYNLTLTSIHSLDWNDSSTAANRLNFYCDSEGRSFPSPYYAPPDSAPAGARHFAIAYGAYTDGMLPPTGLTVIDAAKLTTEQQYIMDRDDLTEFDLSTVPASSFTLNQYSTAATVETNGKAGYVYNGTSSGVSFNHTMPTGNLIKSSGIISGMRNAYGNSYVWYVDATTDDIEIQFNEHVYGTFIILGNKEVRFLIPGGQGRFKFGGGTSDYEDVFIMREKLYAQIYSGQTLGIGDKSPFEAASVGKTYIYAGQGTDIEYRGTNSIIAAIFYALTSEFQNAASSGTTISVDYNGIPATKEYCTFGTVLSSEYRRTSPNGGGSSSSPNGNGGMPPAAPPEDGKPNFEWDLLRYLSGQN
jgi:hypothetical protein